MFSLFNKNTENGSEADKLKVKVDELASEKKQLERRIAALEKTLNARNSSSGGNAKVSRASRTGASPGHMKNSRGKSSSDAVVTANTTAKASVAAARGRVTTTATRTLSAAVSATTIATMSSPGMWSRAGNS